MWADLDIKPVRTADTPPCTWQDFKQKVVTCKRITTELFSNLYDETYQLGSVTGKISTNGLLVYILYDYIVHLPLQDSLIIFISYFQRQK
jgi:hypothetical protein